MKKHTHAHVTLALSLAALALTVVLLSSGGRASAATFTVNATNDGGDASVGNGVCAAPGGACTLRAAIQEANASAGIPDTIVLPAGTFSIGGSGDDTAASGDLDITSHLTINGAGPQATIIDAGGTDRVFDLAGLSIVTFNLKEVTVRNGNPGSFSGGGIRVGNSDTVSLFHVQVSGNIATGGGGISSAGNLTVTDSTVRDNFAGGDGGGIDTSLSVGSLTVNGSTFLGNTAAGSGGGGIYNRRPNTTITNSTFEGNSSTGVGGGGAIRNGSTGSLTVTNATISNNSGSTGAGGIHNNGSITLWNTIVAYNGSTNCNGAIGALHSLDSGNTCLFSGPGDINNANPWLGALDYYGGATLHHSLLPGSPAINTADNAACPPADQRGVSRPQGGTCDMGSHEYSSGPAPTPTPTPTPVPTPAPTPSPTPVPAPPDAFGNVDCMTGIGSVDALKVLRYAAALSYIQTDPCEDIGMDNQPADGRKQGDVDCNGQVNSVDALKLLRYAAGLSYTQEPSCPNIGS